MDLIAHEHIGSNIVLNKNERQSIVRVLHHAVMVGRAKVSVLAAIEMMCESLKRILLKETDEELSLPTVLPTEFMEAVTE